MLTTILCIYRSFLERRTREQQHQAPDWNVWKYVHRIVCEQTLLCIGMVTGTPDPFSKENILSIQTNRKVMLYACTSLQDQPQQTNSYDCGVFASQVWNATTINNMYVCEK